ncbi:MAG TPA: hypothetical protein PKA38_04910 [Candidatus Levybacteria bacterium]|nr:hypothetical protein [Candidatus Levybacteria bacterium]
MPDKPTVTPDHIKKYQQIMGVTATPKSQPVPTATKTVTQPETKDARLSFLSSLPKPTGIGNKMFIFTGKKKIIIDGTDKEVENVKTIDPKDIKKDTPPPVPPPATKEDLVAKQVETVTIPSNQKEEEKKPKNSIPASTTKSEQAGQRKKFPLALVLVFFFLFMGVWILFWLVFFGFIKM